MKRTNRAALFACAAIASLAFAGSALASFAPKLVVSSNGGQASGGPTRIGVSVANADDPTAQVSIYIPPRTPSPPRAPGKLGDVTATAARPRGTRPAADRRARRDRTNGRDQCDRPGLRRLAAADLEHARLLSRPDARHPGVRRGRGGPRGRGRLLDEARRLPAAAESAARRAPIGAKLLSATFTSSAITAADGRR